MAIKQRYLFGGGRLQRWMPWLLLAPGLFFYLLIGVGPSLATAIYSFTDATGIRGLPISWVGWDKWKVQFSSCKQVVVLAAAVARPAVVAAATGMEVIM